FLSSPPRWRLAFRQEYRETTSTRVRSTTRPRPRTDRRMRASHNGPESAPPVKEQWRLQTGLPLTRIQRHGLAHEAETIARWQWRHSETHRLRPSQIKSASTAADSNCSQGL